MTVLRFHCNLVRFRGQACGVQKQGESVAQSMRKSAHRLRSLMERMVCFAR